MKDTLNGDAHTLTLWGTQPVPSKVSNVLQHIYHKMDSQLIFLNFKLDEDAHRIKAVATKLPVDLHILNLEYSTATCNMTVTHSESAVDLVETY